MTTALNDTLPAPAPDTPTPDRAGHSGTARLPTTDTALDSASLLQGGKAVSIRHNGEVYRLQSTRQGKLILTK